MGTVCKGWDLDKTEEETIGENIGKRNHPRLWLLKPCSRCGDMVRGVSFGSEGPGFNPRDCTGDHLYKIRPGSAIRMRTFV